MQRRIDRRQMLNALMASTAIGLSGCAAGGNANLGPTGSLPGPEGEGEAAQKGAKGPAVKVGLLLPLSASPQIAAIAKAMQQAAEFALFERPNVNLQLVVKDDKGTPEGAKAAAEEALKAGVELILGPLFSKSVTTIAPVARAANVPLIGFSNDPAAAVPGVHLLSFLADSEIERVVEHASAQGRKVFAALLPDDAGSKNAEQTFRSAVERGGGRVALVERYQVDQAGILEPSRKLKDAFDESRGDAGTIDALYVPGGADILPQLSFLIGQAKIDTRAVKLLGSSGWDYAGIGREARLLGAWFAAPDPRGWRDFSAKFSQTYGAMPPRLASLAFDAVDVASNFAGQPKGQRYTAANLTRASGFVGVDGPFRLLPNGRNQRGLAVLEVQKAGPAVLEPAPSALPTTPVAGAASPRFSAGLQTPR